MTLLIRWCAGLGSIALAIWAINEPKAESIGAALGSLAVLLGTFIGRGRGGKNGQNQNVTGDSTAIQAGRDVNVRGSADRK